MGKVLLCTGEYARTPYYFGNICVNIYSIEELCHLLATNPFMVDADIMDKELAEWIGKECGLQDLSHQLLSLFRRGIQPGTFVDTIMDYVKYNTPKERQRIKEALTSNVGLNEFERHKKQGDYLVRNGRYQLAIMEYDKMLREQSEMDNELKADVYHNMGVACSKLFRFESAAKYLKKAYELGGKKESGIQYLIAMKEILNDNQYISFLADNGQYYELSLEVERIYDEAKAQFEATREYTMLSALEIYKEEGNTSSYYEEIDKVIAGLKDSYREIVAG